MVPSRSAYAVVGSILWCVMQSIGELATLVRLHSSFLLGSPCRSLSRRWLTDEFVAHSSPPLVRSLTGRPGLLTRPSVSRWVRSSYRTCGACIILSLTSTFARP